MNKFSFLLLAFFLMVASSKDARNRRLSKMVVSQNGSPGRRSLFENLAVVKNTWCQQYPSQLDSFWWMNSLSECWNHGRAVLGCTYNCVKDQYHPIEWDQECIERESSCGSIVYHREVDVVTIPNRFCGDLGSALESDLWRDSIAECFATGAAINGCLYNCDKDQYHPISESGCVEIPSQCGSVIYLKEVSSSNHFIMDRKCSIIDDSQDSSTWVNNYSTCMAVPDAVGCVYDPGRDATRDERDAFFPLPNSNNVCSMSTEPGFAIYFKNNVPDYAVDNAVVWYHTWCQEYGSSLESDLWMMDLQECWEYEGGEGTTVGCTFNALKQRWHPVSSTVGCTRKLSSIGAKYYQKLDNAVTLVNYRCQFSSGGAIANSLEECWNSDDAITGCKYIPNSWNADTDSFGVFKSLVGPEPHCDATGVAHQGTRHYYTSFIKIDNIKSVFDKQCSEIWQDSDLWVDNLYDCLDLPEAVNGCTYNCQQDGYHPFTTCTEEEFFCSPDEGRVAKGHSTIYYKDN